MPIDNAAGAPPIVQYWHSEEIPADIAELIDTFREQNPEMRHMLFCEAKAEEFIAEHLTAREVAAFRACAVPAMQADYFRYCAGYALGGISSDVDVRCLGSLRTFIDTPDEGLLVRGSYEQVISGFFWFRSSGHPLLRLALDLATANIEQRSPPTVWAATGPWILAALVALDQLGSIDALRTEVAKLPMDVQFERFVRLVGDPARVAQALKGVRIVPYEGTTSWIGPPGPLEYKRSEMHWTNWQKRATIFRSHAN
jgi:Glycosyltransferase sugar-binding region containing DXD motif